MKLLILLAVITLTGVCADHIMQTKDQHHHGHHHQHHGHHHHHGHQHHHHGHHHHGHHYHILDIQQITEILQAYLEKGTQSLSTFHQDLGEWWSSLNSAAHRTFDEEIINLSRYLNKNLEKFRGHSFFHKLCAEVHERLEAIRQDVAEHLSNVDLRGLHEAVDEKIGKLRNQLAYTFKHLLHDKIEYAQEVSNDVVIHLNDFKEHWASLVNLYDVVVHQYEKIQEVMLKIKGGKKGGMEGPMKGGMKGAMKGAMKGGMKGAMKGGMKGAMKGGMKGAMKGDMEGGCKGERRRPSKRGMKRRSKGNKKRESSEENRRDAQKKVHAWLKAFSKSVHSH